jgi:hypothetical protein
VGKPEITPKPLSTTGEYKSGVLIKCEEVWSEDVDFEWVRGLWFGRYHPNGYQTSVTKAPSSREGTYTVKMERYSSAD